LVAAGFNLRKIADDKRNLKVAATSKKEGLQHSHFSIAKIFYSSSLTTLLQEDLKNGSFKNNRRTWS
jgi:predicted nuclease of restriction endonuclease-like (RecB) superfamily